MRPASPLVSVVTPVYQGMPFLEECIDSVRGQTLGDWEYVILDNASSDGSWEAARAAAEEDERIRAHRNERTLPFVQNWNRSIDLVSPESRYIKVVHADDWIEPRCLEEMVRVAEEHDRVSVVGAWVESGSEINCRWEDAPGEVMDGAAIARLSLLGEVPYLFGSPTSILMRAETVRAQDRLYDESDTELLGQVVDQDACYRLLHGHDFGYVSEVLTATREHEDSLTADNERLTRWYAGKIALHLRYGPAYLEDGEYATKLREWMDRYYRFLGREVWSGRSSEFWDYHADALERLGSGLQRGRLAGAAAADVGRRFVRGVPRRLRSLRDAISESVESVGSGGVK